MGVEGFPQASPVVLQGHQMAAFARGIIGVVEDLSNIVRISESVEIALMKPIPDMWNKVLTTFRRALDKLQIAYAMKAKSEF